MWFLNSLNMSRLDAVSFSAMELVTGAGTHQIDEQAADGEGQV